MPLNERITRVDDLRSWRDQIPFHYVYTAGVAGERFFRGLQDGKILAANCSSCGRKYLPPKMYCVNCFVEISDFVDVGSVAKVRALAESRFDFDGNAAQAPRTFAFLTFKGVEGGILHYAGDGLKVGSRAIARFRPKQERKGTMLDIEGFY
jgi:uncharacterized OB-fold protein